MRLGAVTKRGHAEAIFEGFGAVLGLVLPRRPRHRQLADAGHRVHRDDRRDEPVRRPALAHLPGGHRRSSCAVVDDREVLDLREADALLLRLQPGLHPGRVLGHEDADRARAGATVVRGTPRPDVPGGTDRRTCCSSSWPTSGRPSRRGRSSSSRAPSWTRGWTSTTSSSARSTRSPARSSPCIVAAFIIITTGRGVLLPPPAHRHRGRQADRRGAGAAPAARPRRPGAEALRHRPLRRRLPGRPLHLAVHLVGRGRGVRLGALAQQERQGSALVLRASTCAMLLTAGAIVLIPGAPLIAITMFVQVVAVTLLPSALVFLILILNDPAFMGEHVNTRWQNVANWGIVLFVIVDVHAVRAQHALPAAGSGRRKRRRPWRRRRLSCRECPTCRQGSAATASSSSPSCSSAPSARGRSRTGSGKVTDLVFALKEPYPEAVGHLPRASAGASRRSSSPGSGSSRSRTTRSSSDAARPGGQSYPPFVDQPGWILLDAHLMGRTILDMDGRRTEVVNDVHLLEAKGHLLLVHVDISFNGFLRRWGLGKLKWVKDELISWKYVQPLSVEDAVATDKVSLSVTRRQMLGPAERGPGRRARGADGRGAGGAVLRPGLREGRRDAARGRAARPAPADRRPAQGAGAADPSEMSVPQLANLFSVLPHDDATELMDVLSPEDASRIRAILSEREATAGASDVARVRRRARRRPGSGRCSSGSGSRGRSRRRSRTSTWSTGRAHPHGRRRPARAGARGGRHAGLVDHDARRWSRSRRSDAAGRHRAQIFAKYHYRMIPVVDTQDRILGVIRYNDIMTGAASRKE